MTTNTASDLLERYDTPHTYAERLGVDARRYLDELSERPKRPLDPAEKGAFYSFDKDIFDGSYISESGEVFHAEGEITDWYKNTAKPPIDFVLDFFETDEGKQLLAEYETKFGVQGGTPEATSYVITAQRLVALVDKLTAKQDEEAFKSLAKQSHTARVEKLKIDWQQEQPDPQHFKIQLKPEKVLDRIETVASIRQFLREVWRDVAERGDMSENLRDALLVEIDCFRQRSSEILGELYPRFVDIYKQTMLSTDPELKARLLAKLEAVNKPLLRVSEEIIDEQESGELIDLSPVERANQIQYRFAFTMDKWRNGYVKGEENTPLSVELLELEAAMSTLQANASETTVEHVFNDEEIQYLESLVFTASDVETMFQEFLRSNAILSQCSSDDYKEGYWPTDSTASQPKIGVVIGEFENLQYDRGWLKIPRKTKRKLRQAAPAGVALVVPHELEHAIDGITSEYGEKQVMATRSGTRLSEGVREGVGKHAECEASIRFFGTSLTPNLGYLHAIRSLLNHEGETQAVIEFARASAEKEGNPDITGFMMHGENRVQRLINYGGINSRGLVYLEQELIRHALNNYPVATAKAVGTNSYLDLRSQAKLHQFGLLGSSRYQPEVTPLDSVEAYFKNILRERKEA